MGILDATWITGTSDSDSLVFRKEFHAFDVKQSVIDICGLGLFNLYINGVKIGDSEYEPAATTYEGIDNPDFPYPLKDKFASPRYYYYRYDITQNLQNGKNLLSVQLGHGFFKKYMEILHGSDFCAEQMLAFSLSITDAAGETETIESDTSVLVGGSHITFTDLHLGEIQDMNLYQDFHSPLFNEKGFTACRKTVPPKGECSLYDFPKDRVIREINPILIGTHGNKRIYDLGENISGRLCLNTVAGYVGDIIIEHSEEIFPNYALNVRTAGWSSFADSDVEENQVQRFVVRCDGRVFHNVHPQFSWQAFRYFSVEGDAEITKCEVIHTDIECTAEFKCDDILLNQIFDVYKRTQLDNIHGCIPSDCPHRERYGYTGDGQITCETAMTVFDTRQMYRKWMQDILDCRNIENGHIQRVAPFVYAGGGPCGWGGAVIIVPYTYYKVYGDRTLVDHCLHPMLQFLDYIESRCENGLVVREEEEAWCLGDWCYEGCDPHDDLPFTRDFVNTIYLIKFYDLMLDLDRQLGLGIDTTDIKVRQERHKEAIIQTYYDDSTGDFCKNLFAANAFALYVGLGDSRTLTHLVSKYDALAGFDTGIFGTEILMRVLCDNGYSQLAYKLLTSKMKNHSFGYMIDQGATTLWEEWDGAHSHNHPMFGGCLKVFWNHFLGIKNLDVGYRSVLINPCDIKEMGNMSGSIMTPMGRICVDLMRNEKQLKIVVTIPDGVDADFTFRGFTKCLKSGTNVIKINNK